MGQNHSALRQRGRSARRVDGLMHWWRGAKALPRASSHVSHAIAWRILLVGFLVLFQPPIVLQHLCRRRGLGTRRRTKTASTASSIAKHKTGGGGGHKNLGGAPPRGSSRVKGDDQVQQGLRPGRASRFGWVIEQVELFVLVTPPFPDRSKLVGGGQHTDSGCLFFMPAHARREISR